eukprot:g4536.t1
MYAFAIWDKKNKTYLVARDPVGIIPLYIGWGSDGSVQVASELKALHKVTSSCAVAFRDWFRYVAGKKESRLYCEVERPSDVGGSRTWVACVFLAWQDLPESQSKGRELVLLYVLSDPNSKDTPIPYRWVDRNSATLDEASAADDVVSRGSRAASEDNAPWHD